MQDHSRPGLQETATTNAATPLQCPSRPHLHTFSLPLLCRELLLSLGEGFSRKPVKMLKLGPRMSKAVLEMQARLH